MEEYMMNYRIRYLVAYDQTPGQNEEHETALSSITAASFNEITCLLEAIYSRNL